MRLEIESTGMSIHTGVGRVRGPIERSRDLEIKQGRIGGKNITTLLSSDL